MNTLTGRQRSVVVAVHYLTETHGYPPTLQEIGDAVGLRSTGAVHPHITALTQAGLLHTDPYLPRSVRLAPSVVVSHSGAVARVVTVFGRCRPCGRAVPTGHTCPEGTAA